MKTFKKFIKTIYFAKQRLWKHV